jgi:Plasmid pRiA4b ORF-3-like protein
LLGISPIIWRRLLVRSDSTIANLHDTLQITFGWSDDHLHRFLIHGRQDGVAYIGGITFRDDPRRIKLSDLGLRVKEKFFYEYDFNDQWRHLIRVEAILPAEGSVAKIGWGRKKPGPDSSLGGNLEEALHESHLSANVAFPDSFNLALPYHVHCLDPADRPPRRLETEEAESGIDSALDESVVLLDYVIEVLRLA